MSNGIGVVVSRECPDIGGVYIVVDIQPCRTSIGHELGTLGFMLKKVENKENE